MFVYVIPDESELVTSRIFCATQKDNRRSLQNEGCWLAFLLIMSYIMESNQSWSYETSAKKNCVQTFQSLPRGKIRLSTKQKYKNLFFQVHVTCELHPSNRARGSAVVEGIFFNFFVYYHFCFLFLQFFKLIFYSYILSYSLKAMGQALKKRL